jgi:hypothetical protein
LHCTAIQWSAFDHTLDGHKPPNAKGSCSASEEYDQYHLLPDMRYVTSLAEKMTKFAPMAAG